MNILSLNKKKSYIPEEPFSTPSYANNDDWLNPDQFMKSMNREISRSYRSGHALSYIIFDLTEYTELKVNDFSNKRLKFTHFMKLLMEVINKHTRAIDLKCWKTSDQIEILLVDTSIQNAKLYIKKIRNHIVQLPQAEKFQGFQEFLNAIQVYDYPLNQLTGKNEIGVNTKLKKRMIQGNGRTNQIIKNIKPIPIHKDDDSFDKLRISNSETSVLVTRTDFSSVSFNKVGSIAFRFTKRIVDILGSLFGILVFLPIMISIALVIKLTSKGPALFRQKRVGYLGKEFTFLKFRSMRTNVDDSIHQEYVKKLIKGKHKEINKGTEEKPLYKIVNDPRITRIGHILRKTSLDELPQFFNVLTGHMSLVGPRPPIPYEIENYKNWHLKRVLEVKPGITGMWQVYGRSQTTFDDMVRYDLQYVTDQSIRLDIKLLFKTFVTIFQFEGAM